MNLNFVKSRIYFFIVSLLLVFASLIMLLIPPALVPGIDFSSGTTMLISTEENIDQASLRELYDELGHSEARIQSSLTANDKYQYLIRTKTLEVPQNAFTFSGASQSSQSLSVNEPQNIEAIGTVTAGNKDGTKEVIVLRDAFQSSLKEVQKINLLAAPMCSAQLGGASFDVAAGTVLDVLGEPSLSCGGNPSDQTYSILYEDKIVFLVATDGINYQSNQLPERKIDVNLGERSVIELAIYNNFGDFDVLEFSSVSPIVSKVAVRNAIIAVLITTLFIMGYVAYAFSEMPRPFRYALAAIIALVHDVIIVVGTFSLMGKFWDFEVNLMVITGLLTILGFSVHDSIVVFDRIRENIQRNPLNTLSQNVNTALIETLARSLNTSITLLITVMTLLFIGGPTIREFLVTMFVGIIIGTYSSIAIAAQLLVAWDEGDFQKFLSKIHFKNS
ncbi:MAG: protein translocase subunit SecF [Dehalococcoidia bacterium]|jgi:preprotein translocase subunit SecF